MNQGRRLRKAWQRAVRSALFRAFIVLQGLLQWLGPTRARALGRGIGALAGVLLPYERRVAAANLERALPERSATERAAIRAGMFRHLGESAVELMFSENTLDNAAVALEGLEAVTEALAEGRGAVAVTGHIGNWELMAAALARRGIPITVVARRLFDDRFDAWMRAWRDRYGIHTLVRDEPGAVKAMLRALKQGHLLGLLIDQDTDVPSAWVPFFGTPAKTPDAPARLAARGIPVLVAADRRIGPWRHAAAFRRLKDLPADPTEILARLSLELEAEIRAVPEQWVWLHRRWQSPPPGAERYLATNSTR